MKVAAVFPNGLRFGRGVLVRDGVVVTICRAVQGATRTSIKLPGNMSPERAAAVGVSGPQYDVPAVLGRQDTQHDLCELIASGLRGRAVEIGDSDSLQVGERVYTVGATQGLQPMAVDNGVVSSFPEFDGRKYIASSAIVAPVANGAGLFNEKQQLVGVTVRFHVDGGDRNVAVPAKWVAQFR
ncbi:MAG TPA: serine protease [Polyangiaceae bacterium]|nr:serine protease [Polyangiaceae bacterium]